MNASHHIHDNIVKFNLSHEVRKDKDRHKHHFEYYPYALKITAKSEVFEAVAYL